MSSSLHSADCAVARFGIADNPKRAIRKTDAAALVPIFGRRNNMVPVVLQYVVCTISKDDVVASQEASDRTNVHQNLC